jgi:outer-membrane receptor for ferric coprogen and ferric-rhodotorulic acid
MKVPRPLRLTPLVLLAASALAQQPLPTSVVQRVILHIDPQPVGDALSEFARQTGLTVMIQSAVGHGVISPKLDGKYTPATALDQLLAHTGLHYEYLDAKTVVVLGPHAETKSTVRRNIALDSGVVQLPGPATEGRTKGSGMASTEPHGDTPAILVNRLYQPRY